MTGSYNEIILLPTFEERFNYAQEYAKHSRVGEMTFAGSRWLNQVLYKSEEWKAFRREMIIRDDGCDLAISDRPVNTRLILHHINPLTVDQVLNRDPCIFSPNNVICVSFDTHNSLHYGDIQGLPPTLPTTRRPNDTCPWIK